MIKIVTWKAEVSASIFGALENPSIENSKVLHEAKNIVPIAHTQDASEYVGISFEEVTPVGCSEITDITPDTYYFFHNPSKGYYLTIDLVNSVLKDMRQTELDKLTINYKGIVFKANEESQNRIARTIQELSDSGEFNTKEWKIDNKFVVVTKQEFIDVLRLAGIAQTELWKKYTL